MSWISAALLGLVEGITEFLPISSTAHLLLFGSFILRLPESEFFKSFDIIIQCGALVAVLVIYAWRILANRRLFLTVLVAFLPTAVLGLVFYKFVKTFLFGNVAVILSALFIGGVLMILFERHHKEVLPTSRDISVITYKQAFLIGLFQSVALIPGVSRAGATIIGGLLLGLNRKTIIEFSFLLAVPTLFAATGLDVVKNIHIFSAAQALPLAIGLVVSFVVALVSIKWLLRFIETHSFKVFGWYRIVLVLVVLAAYSLKLI